MYDNLNYEFNTPSAKISFEKVDSKRRSYITPLSNRGGSTSRYPWRDPSYTIGDSFWKAVSKEELDAEKCRPGVPPSVRKEGINWKTKACYDNHKKQYGWLVTRVA
tara:strand:+ start:246 stop:563 length:318 start_codon:yes stop_codon:yes gene_type:complete